MAQSLVTCSWCSHGMVNNETHGRIKTDQQPNQCNDCSECRTRRMRGEAAGAENDVNVTPITIETAQPGMSLVVKQGGHARLFQVENKKFSYQQGEGTVFTLESERLAGGTRWSIAGPAGTVVHRVTRKY
jgi:hypothetical protein